MYIIDYFKNKKIEEITSTSIDELHCGKLYSVKSANKGFLTLNELFHEMCNVSEDSSKRRGYAIHLYPDQSILEERTIVYKKLCQKYWRIPYQGEEILTGEKFDFVGINEYEIYSYNEVLDTFIFDSELMPTKNKSDIITKYIKEHSDLDLYKQQLIDIKEKGLEYHQKAIENQYFEEGLRSIKKYISQPGVIQYKNYHLVMNICINFINENGIKFIQNNRIDTLLSIIKKQYPNLSDDQIKDITKVLLFCNHLETAGKIEEEEKKFIYSYTPYGY